MRARYRSDTNDRLWTLIYKSELVVGFSVKTVVEAGNHQIVITIS
jgi:hypothetical protein